MVERPTILVVDDDDDTRNSVSLVLEAEGYVVRGARDGHEALESLAVEGRPEVMLLDLMMPVMNGWSVLDALAEMPRFADLPVVIFTAAGDHAASSIERPVLRKPIDLEELLDTIARLCAPCAGGATPRVLASSRGP